MLGPDEDGAEAYQRYLESLPCPACASLRERMTVEGVANHLHDDADVPAMTDELCEIIARAVIAYLTEGK